MSWVGRGVQVGRTDENGPEQNESDGEDVFSVHGFQSLCSQSGGLKKSISSSTELAPVMWVDGSGLPRFIWSINPSKDSGSTGPVTARLLALDTISCTVRLDLAHFWSQVMSVRDTGSPRSIREHRNSTLRRVSVDNMAVYLIRPDSEIGRGTRPSVGM